MVGLLACGVSLRVQAQDADLQAMGTIANDFQNRVHVRGISDAAFLPPPAIRIVTTPTISFYDEHGTVTEARFKELPPPVQGVFNQWASFTSDQVSGETLFRDSFYRFFFVHELGHWLQARVLSARGRGEEKWPAVDEDFYQDEIQSNRIAIAWWREHDVTYLDRLITGYRQIEARMPNPVPAGQDKLQFFNANYAKLGNEPDVYGWYQLDLVITAYDRPKESFQQVLDSLPSVNYKRAQ
ncbi:MAG: hypothetical protein ABR987_16575 [Terracidiphilus sp.]|jgi:hypothetical protein